MPGKPAGCETKLCLERRWKIMPEGEICAIRFGLGQLVLEFAGKCEVGLGARQSSERERHSGKHLRFARFEHSTGCDAFMPIGK